MIKAGKINQLKISRRTDFGFYLKDKEETEILLPNAYITSFMEIGQAIDVFIYHDSENRLVASTLYPKAKVGEFAFLEVTDISSFGAFVDWGLPKELFVPLKYQKTPFKVGEYRVIRVVLDEMSGRVMGVEKFGSFMPKSKPKFALNDHIELFILAKTPLGFKAIINNRFEGMLYKNEIFTELEVGEMRYGYIKKMRTDGKIDVSLQPIQNEEFIQNKILEILRKNNYKMPYNTKSSHEDIYKTFGVSKKSFKAVINMLQKEGVIKITEFGVEAN